MQNIKRSLVSLFLCFSCALCYSQSYNYAEVLQKSIWFYEVQQSGPLTPWNRVSWRGDAFVNDGADIGIDLNGGWFDAGDHVKFGFPMAFTTTALAWGAIEYREAYEQSGQLDEFSNNLRFVTDYFLKAFINDTPGQYEFVGQIGDGGNDHAFWGPAEVANLAVTRPTAIISTSCPGSDIVGETAAALAASSIFFRESGDIAYADLLVEKAIKLYDFADNYRGKYSDCITGVASFYNSWSGFQDEIVWGAIWLYKATGDPAYLQKAESEYDNLATEPQSPERSYRWTLAWDDKSYGCYVLMAQATGKAKYTTDAERWLDYWTVGFNNQSVSYSPGGQAHLDQWGSLRYAANTSFAAFVYSDWLAQTGGSQTLIDRYHDFAVRQINYALGDNPRNSSYVVGFGNNPPLSPHHRTAHGGWQNNVTGLPEINRHTLFGALVGGPLSANDQYVDERGDFIMNEVACDYNAAFQSSVARMYLEFGGTPLSNFPVPEVPEEGEEYFNLVKVNAEGSTFTEVSVRATNHSAFPAMVTDNISYRYFVDLSEGFAAGYTLADYRVTSNSGGTASPLIPLDEENNLYYVEVRFNDAVIYPGGDNRNFVESQMRIALPNTAPASAWDPTNDFSYLELMGNTLVKARNIPFFNNDILLFGNEPAGGDVPRAVITASVTSGEFPLAVDFDGSNSVDPNGDVLAFAWDFGDGNTATGATVSHTYTTAGVYTATLTVDDGNGNSSTESVIITVLEPNIAPEASFTASPTSGDVPLTVSFDASASSDANNDPLTFAWDFGDGTSASGVAPSHTFSLAGTFLVTLTVNDGRGGTGIDTLSITVNAVPNDPPIAVVSVSDTLGETPFVVSFDGSASTDPDNDILTYTWDFGDGATSTGVTTTHTYTVAGSYEAVLTVMDGKGGIDSASVAITVEQGDCSLLTVFGVPTAGGLPTIENTSFDYVHVLGVNGPDLSNIANFVINWANEPWGSGLWQMSAQTNDGVPNWWNDLRTVSSNTFASAEPTLTFSGSGFPGLDGTYYVNVDGNNFVIVATTGEHAIYFSNSATPPVGCGIANARLAAKVESQFGAVVMSNRVYPNPSDTEFSLNTTHLTGEITVINAWGQEVRRFNAAEVKNDELKFGRGLESGIYYITIREDNKLKALKLIKQ